MIRNIGQPIAYGRTAEVYAWHNKQVLKLFYEWFGLDNIENEARINHLIHANGLPTPVVGKIVRVNDRYGLEYEHVHGESMWKMFQRKPWNAIRYARRWAELQAMVHGRTIQSDLPSQRDKLRNNILQAKTLPANLQRKVLATLDAMPNGDQLCHGDLWPGNILITPKGEIVIDWIHASRGNPLADLARSTNLALGFIKTRQVKRAFLTYGSSTINQIKNSFLQILCQLILPIYINHYFKLCPGDEDEYHRWLPIIAAARLADNIPELEAMLLFQVEKGLLSAPNTGSDGTDCHRIAAGVADSNEESGSKNGN